jgi:hypothetical protein
MKTMILTTTLASIFVASAPLLAQTSGAGKQPAPATESTLSTTTAAVEGGIVVKDGQTYIIQDGRATLVDTTNVPAGHMRTMDGRTVRIPDGVTGLPAGGAEAKANKAKGESQATEGSTRDAEKPSTSNPSRPTPPSGNDGAAGTTSPTSGAGTNPSGSGSSTGTNR